MQTTQPQTATTYPTVHFPEDEIRTARAAAAWDAASAAASAAATEALRPTVETLQASAWALLDDMLAVTEQAR